jgi:RNA polymerase sigma-70 factor, ECF subfamily
MKASERNFQEIFNSFQPKIDRYLGRLVGESEAADLTQEVFIKVSKSLVDFRGESKLSTWIYRIATNTALDTLRNPSHKLFDQNRSSNSDGEEIGTDTIDRNASTREISPPVEHQVFRKEMNDCIHGFIDSLPADQRTVLLLSEFEDFKDDEIANVLGVPCTTVKIRLHRARERLKQELEQNCDSAWIEDNEFIPELLKK